jgi:serine-type D-Ala-D-Ala carboxypeptidase/endopeptidase (penicillin-binding protein 4)
MYKIVSFLLIFSFASGAALPLPPKLEEIMRQEKYQHANWGILVKDALTQKILYEKNSNQLFLPGSTTKLFSVAALFHAYGEDYRFKTPVYAVGNLKEGVLKGDLILVGQGDLTFGGRQEAGSEEIAFTKIDHIYANALPEALLTPEDPLNAIRALAVEVKKKGIQRIVGDVLIDDRLFETTELRGMMISPVMINENLIDLILRPGKAGEPVDLVWRPRVAGYKVVNDCKTVEKSGPLQIEIQSDKIGHTLQVSGTIPEDTKEVIRTFSIQDPKTFAKNAFMQALRDQGIVLNVIGSKLPSNEVYSGLQPIAVWTSPPLSEIGKLILKVSHNLGADLIPLLLAAKNGQTTYAAGMLELGKFTVDEVKVSADSFVFADAAGRDENRLTPQAEVRLLEYARHWPHAEFQRFYKGLPVLGVDGSLQDFGKGTAAVGKIYAKTGTGISFNLATGEYFLTAQVLSGYIEGDRLLEFIIGVNNANMPKLEDIFSIFEDLCQMSAEVYNANSSPAHREVGSQR